MASQVVDANPRKLPRQARSKATVDAVITAAAQILIEHGYEGATTARVAERAGVSVGSLYQYFPNKEALIAVLIERHADEIVGIMQRALSDPANITLEDGLRAIIAPAPGASPRSDPPQILTSKCRGGPPAKAWPPAGRSRGRSSVSRAHAPI